MTPQDHIKLNKCLFVNLLICEIQGYWAAYAAKKVYTVKNGSFKP